MLCEKCGMRTADVVFSEIVDGVLKKHNYCRKCASEIELRTIMDNVFPLKHVLSGILKAGIEKPSNEEDKFFSDLRCPKCRMTYKKFLEKSMYGCSECYYTFSLLMDRNIKNIQGSMVHTGKIPRFQKRTLGEDIRDKNYLITVKTLDEEINDLKEKMQYAVDIEDYKTAALFRDKIKRLKNEDSGYE